MTTRPVTTRPGARPQAASIARALRDGLRAEEAFGAADAILPVRTRPRPTLTARREAPRVTTPTPAPARNDETEALAEVAAGVAGCTRCPLCRTRTQTVFGSGSPTADLMIIGEAPGAAEDRTGLPFVGRAGQLLTKMLAAIDLDRERDVYICNVLKCRPPSNRDPEPPEIASCLSWLKRQIDLVAPRVILTLGAPATRTVLDTTESISRIRGREIARYGATVIPSFHPAYLLRNPAAKRESWIDLKLVRKRLDEAGSRRREDGM